MKKYTSREHFLSVLRRERSAWDRLVAGLDSAQMDQPGACGEWSVKEIIAPSTFFEREMIGMLQAVALAGSELWDLPTDERNAVIFLQNRSLPVEKDLANSMYAFKELQEQVRALKAAIGKKYALSDVKMNVWEKHGRILKLIGGTLMLTLAGVMLVNPSLMSSLSASLLVFAMSSS